MSKLNREDIRNYKALASSALDLNTDHTIISSVGTHFFKVINKLSEKSVFDKLNKINNIKEEKINYKDLRKDREFYIAKIRNLKCKQEESLINLDMLRIKELESKEHTMIQNKV